MCRTMLFVETGQSISTELSDESTNSSSKNENTRQLWYSLILLLTFELRMWRKGVREWFGGNTSLLNMFSVLGQRTVSINIARLLSGAAVVVQHMQVRNHCRVLATWGWLEMPAIICPRQQFVGEMVHYDRLALQLKMSWPISLHLLWNNIAKQRLLLLQF